MQGINYAVGMSYAVHRVIRLKLELRVRRKDSERNLKRVTCVHKSSQGTVPWDAYKRCRGHKAGIDRLRHMSLPSPHLMYMSSTCWPWSST